MFDIAIRPQPKLSIKVKRIDPVTGIQTTSESSLLDDNGTPLFDFDDQGVVGLTKCAKGAEASPEGGTAFVPGTPQQDEVTEYDITVGMPTDQWWLANQAASGGYGSVSDVERRIGASGHTDRRFSGASRNCTAHRRSFEDDDESPDGSGYRYSRRRESDDLPDSQRCAEDAHCKMGDLHSTGVQSKSREVRDQPHRSLRP